MIRVNLLSPEKKEVPGGAGEAPAFADEQKENKINVGAGIGAAVITIGLIGFMYYTQTQTLEDKQNLLEEKNAKPTQHRLH